MGTKIGPSSPSDNQLPELSASQPSTEQKKTDLVRQRKLSSSNTASRGNVSISIHRSQIPASDTTSSKTLPKEKVLPEVRKQLDSLKNQPETKAPGVWDDFDWNEETDSPRMELVNQYVEAFSKSIEDNNKNLNSFLIDHAKKEGVNIHEVISRLEPKYSDNPDIKERIDALKQSLKVTKIITKDEAGEDVVKFTYKWRGNQINK